jgi:fatty acid/phospholipid biosynthesis enzyme
VDGISIIAHGGSSTKAIKNAIRVAHEAVRTELNRNMVEAVQVSMKHVQPG